MSASYPDAVHSRRSNAGPPAAMENRQRLLRAAREMFEEDAGEVRFTNIAVRANVGQASLYRNFPDRPAIAWALLDEYLSELEKLAERVSVRELLKAHTGNVLRSAGLVRVVSSILNPDQLAELRSRIMQVYTAALSRELASGTSSVRQRDAADLVMMVQMVTGAVADLPREARPAAAADAWRLLGLPTLLD